MSIEGLLTPDELAWFGQMRSFVSQRERANKASLSYYDGSVKVQNLEIAVPPTLSQIGVVSDWPSTVVNSHHERMTFLGWEDHGRFGMRESFLQLGAEDAVSEAALDSLIFGVGFIALDRFDEQPRFLSVAPTQGTLIWDTVGNRPAAGYRRVRTGVSGAETAEVLYFQNRSVRVVWDQSQNMKSVDVDTHNQGVPMMFRVRNKLRSRRWYGESLITPAVRYYTQAAARTLLGMEINREFYTTPQRWAQNADMSIFTESDNPTRSEMIEAGWRASAGHMLAVPPPEPGEPEIRVGQFSAAPPTPYIEQLRTYSQLVASATGLPSAYLGFSTENPPSGDAIRAWMDRLIRSVESQQRLMSSDLLMMGWLGHRASGGDVDYSEYRVSVRAMWEPPATQMFAADTDAVTKLIATGVVGPQDDWTFDKLRVPAHYREQLRRGARQREMASVLQKLSASESETAAKVADSIGADDGDTNS